MSPGGHHAVDEEVDAGVGEEKEVGHWLRVEEVGGGVIRPVALHAAHGGVHCDHGDDGEHRPGAQWSEIGRHSQHVWDDK